MDNQQLYGYPSSCSMLNCLRGEAFGVRQLGWALRDLIQTVRFEEG
jgi:hypothetical protein